MNEFELYVELRRIFIEWPDMRISYEWDVGLRVMHVELSGPGCSTVLDVPLWLWREVGSRGAAVDVYRGWLVRNPSALSAAAGEAHPRYGLRTDGIAVSVPERAARTRLQQ
jgi:hypothetical protein